MLTVMVGLVGSGKRSTRSPFESRYSVMPSTDVTFSGLPGAAAGAAAFFGAAAGLAAAWVVASAAPAVKIAASRPSPPFFQSRMRSPPTSAGHACRAGQGANEYHTPAPPGTRRGTVHP